MSRTPPPSRLQALQDTLAAEHAAMYVFSLLGAQVSVSRQPALSALLTSTYDAHRHNRDQLMQMIWGLGADPVPPAPAYDPPNAGTSPPQQRAAALRTEQRCADVYGELVAATTRQERSWATSALSACARRQLDFGGRPETFPGYPG